LDSESALIALGRELLIKNDPMLASLEITADNFENSNRKVRIRKVTLAYPIFRDLIIHHAMRCLTEYIRLHQIGNLQDLQVMLPENSEPETWINAGGQLIKASSIKKLVSDIQRNKIQSWEQVHGFYNSQSKSYAEDKLVHALAAWKTVYGGGSKFKEEQIQKMLADALITRGWMNEGIKTSREKDYENPFRQMVYESQAEMNKVIGPLSENSFLLQENEQAPPYQRAE